MKNEINIYVGNPSLSESVQQAAFKAGYKWYCDEGRVSNLDQKVLILSKDDMDIVHDHENVATDYDASTEFGKIIEWLNESTKESEIARLTRENEELRKQLEEKESRLSKIATHVTTDDGFPTPEKERKEIGLSWFVGYLKRCKEVKGRMAGNFGEIVFNFGKCRGDFELTNLDGDLHVISSTKHYARFIIESIIP